MNDYLHKQCPHCGVLVPGWQFDRHTFFCAPESNGHSFACAVERKHEDASGTMGADGSCNYTLEHVTAPVPPDDELVALTPRDFLVAFSYEPKAKDYGPLRAQPVIRSLILTTWWNHKKGITAEFLENQTKCLRLMHSRYMDDPSTLHILSVTVMSRKG